ncbi:hypothetical protein ACJIZ3_019924 [Penstemon smallii]|uniref:Uncharacterized protein n=1 Tax=Penstemon smallii TaxID=265156 RepID=A0ABD3T2H6_9LAMI
MSKSSIQIKSKKKKKKCKFPYLNSFSIRGSIFKLLFLASKGVLQTFKFVSRVSSTYELLLFQLKLQAFSIDDFGLFKLMLLCFIASSSQVDYLCCFKLLLFASKSKLHISSSLKVNSQALSGNNRRHC